jgi:hypothetical protein
MLWLMPPYLAHHLVPNLLVTPPPLPLDLTVVPNLMTLMAYDIKHQCTIFILYTINTMKEYTWMARVV